MNKVKKRKLKTPNQIQNEFGEFDITDLNPTERHIIKFVYHWDKQMPPNTRDISEGLNLPQSTVSSTLKRMKDTKKDKKDIFQYEPHHGVALTDEGKQIAEHIEHHHHIMEIYLHESLGLDEINSHQESELLGISVSCNLTNIILKKYKLSKDSLGQFCICPDEKGTECVLK